MPQYLVQAADRCPRYHSATIYCWTGGAPNRAQSMHSERNRGCLDALMIDEAVARETKVRKRNLSVAWVDYRKAFDMAHGSAIIMLKSIRAHNWIRRTVRNNSSQKPTHASANRQIPNLERGVFQGYSFYPLIFCLAVPRLSPGR